MPVFSLALEEPGSFHSLDKNGNESVTNYPRVTAGPPVHPDSVIRNIQSGDARKKYFCFCRRAVNAFTISSDHEDPSKRGKSIMQCPNGKGHRCGYSVCFTDLYNDIMRQVQLQAPSTPRPRTKNVKIEPGTLPQTPAIVVNQSPLVSPASSSTAFSSPASSGSSAASSRSGLKKRKSEVIDLTLDDPEPLKRLKDEKRPKKKAKVSNESLQGSGGCWKCDECHAYFAENSLHPCDGPIVWYPFV
ncbi:hypothetical protein VKT23_016580 [Stygiomarasmius scandens]|uniref:Uncharacterized protein n=1 Tax=Marasmiellus scandens TaxID=2682957 RepID=A0ABR1IX59_9AGAR